MEQSSGFWRYFERLELLFEGAPNFDAVMADTLAGRVLLLALLFEFRLTVRLILAVFASCVCALRRLRLRLRLVEDGEEEFVVEEGL
jgi:hypothetical protein